MAGTPTASFKCKINPALTSSTRVAAACSSNQFVPYKSFFHYLITQINLTCIFYFKNKNHTCWKTKKNDTFIKPGKIYYAQPPLHPDPVAERVWGRRTGSHYPTKIPGERGARGSFTLYFKLDSSLSQNYQVYPRKIPVLPLFTLQEAVPSWHHRSYHFCRVCGFPERE